MVALEHFMEHRAADHGRAGKLLDCQGEPTLHQGADGDVAVAPRGTCWSKKAGAWQYEDDLGEVTERSVKPNRSLSWATSRYQSWTARFRSTIPSEPLRSWATSKVKPING